ncbi:MAG TPA: pyridoxamine 5'-phosphate oxidase family protein [Streptosporangiaceae bacterium]|nr:pyridoxamine 5'-phosphate oxidase family protein [Streptosporangiaceae bacterium]
MVHASEDKPSGPALLRPLSPTARTTLRRLREEGRTDRADLQAVLRAGFIAHLGVPAAHGVMVVPTVYGFDTDHVYVHGSVASQSLAAGAEYCLTVTVVDGLVLARSVFEHSVNYRCAMIYAAPRIVTDPAEKLAGLRLVSEHLAPGQWDYVRQPSRKELAATRLLAMSLAEASVKVRTGPPDDSDSPDAGLGLWAGELPLDARWLQPVPDPALPGGITPPAHILARAGNEAHPGGPGPAA